MYNRTLVSRTSRNVSKDRPTEDKNVCVLVEHQIGYRFDTNLKFGTQISITKNTKVNRMYVFIMHDAQLIYTVIKMIDSMLGRRKLPSPTFPVDA